MSVLIVIPTCGRKIALEECVASIVRCTPSPLYDIVVIDGSSKPVQLSSLCQEQIIYFRCPPNWGFTRAVNLGARCLRGDYVVWLNDDCIVQPGWLNAMLDYLFKNHHVGIGAFFFTDDRWPGTGAHVFFYRNLVYPNFGCVRRHVWEELGGFNEAYFAYGAETDLAFRCRARGYDVSPVPGARVHHRYLQDAARKAMVAAMGLKYQELRTSTLGPEEDGNLHWMTEDGRVQSHKAYKEGLPWVKR